MLVGHSLGGKTVLEALRQLQGSGQSVPKQVGTSWWCIQYILAVTRHLDMLLGHSLGGKMVLEALRQLQGSG